MAFLGDPVGAIATCAACAPVLLAIPAAGCYEPVLRDCTVTCASAGECATGQVCGPDGYCARPAVAGTCIAPGHPDADVDGTIDARIAVPDARPAPPRPDAPPAAELAIAITGRGDVDVAPLGASCVADDWMGAACAYPITAGAPIVLTAKTTHKDDRFGGWSGACSGQSATCSLTATSGTTSVTAGFLRKDDH